MGIDNNLYILKYHCEVLHLNGFSFEVQKVKKQLK